MRKKRLPEISPTQCRVLSELAEIKTQSCTQLAKACGIDRSVLYVLVRRLAQRKFVKGKRMRLEGHNGMQVVYSITALGARARMRFVHSIGIYL